MSENARDYICPDIMGRDLTPQETLQMADTFMTMEYRIHQAVQQGLVSYEDVAELVDAFIASRRLG